MTQRNNFTVDPQRPNTFADAGHSVLMNTTESSSTRVSSPPSRTRRAVRIAASLPIEVRDQFGGREETRTQFLMIRGAVLATKSNVRVGHKLTIQNMKSGRSAECHVIAVEPIVKEVHQLEVEFTRPQPDFWPVQFPADEVKANEIGDSHRTDEFPNFSAKTSLTVGHEPMLEVENAATMPINLEAESLPALDKHDDQLVSLADALPQSYVPSPNANRQERYSARTTTLDSVAQFRAANRAAHRREKQMKAFYSFLSVIALAGAVMAWRTWSPRQTEVVHATVARAAQVVARTTPSLPASTTQAQNATIATAAVVRENAGTEPAATPVTSPALVSTEADAKPVETKAEDTPIEVRRGALSASLRKPSAAEAEEAPMALPLHVGDASEAKPDMLNSLVAQAPNQNAVLAPQLPKKIVPAKLVHSVVAQYPPMARQIRAEGEVVVAIDIDATGNISSAKAIAGPPVLRTAAVDAVRHWKYQPATLGDKPVASSDSVKIDFHLH